MSDIDHLLSTAYALDNKGQRAASVAGIKAALEADAALLASAQAKLVELNSLIEVRGKQACAFSTKYWEYLTEALA